MTLTINAGSTSLKYALFNERLKQITRGAFEGETVNEAQFKKMAREAEPFLTRAKISLRVAHRVVNGGHKYKKPVKITPHILSELKKLQPLAPLHNPFNIKGIEFAQKFFPHKDQYAIFDTCFFVYLPSHARIYPIPLSKYTNDHIQKYGFHGISHEYVLTEAQKKLKNLTPNLITAHLGGGCSMTAIKKGKPIDTSMGYSPMEGLMMWSRSGDIDPYLVGKFGIREHMLNYESGLKGISGCKNYLELLERYSQKDQKARLAIKMFIYRIQKYIGAYYAALNGNVDAIVFTGKIGAGDATTRRLILKGLPFLKNARVLVIAPNEELMMARTVNAL